MSKKIRVLVVDDNQNFCTILSEHIKEQDDMEVAGVAHNGLKAVELIKELTPDIVVLDIIMPHLDGLGVLEKIGQEDLVDKTKFIILSAVGQDNITRRAINLGATYYVIKPFDFDLFIDRIRQLSKSKPKADSNEMYGGHQNGVHAEFTSIDARITEILHKIGVPPHIKGFQYIREAVTMVYEDASCLNKVTKIIYPGIAETFNTTPSRVERAIRNAIEIAVNRGNSDYIQMYFGMTLSSKKNKLTNSEFIALIAEKLRMEDSRSN